MKYLMGCIVALVLLGLVQHFGKSSSLPLVAIANYGPHPSLDEVIAGVKTELAKKGWIEGKTVRYDIKNVNFDQALIPQMVMNIKNEHPKVIVVISTPVAQFAKGAIKEIPLVYAAATDPVATGLIPNENTAAANMTGSSDQQNLGALLQFIQMIMPKAQSLGLLYSTADANDVALLKMMVRATAKMHMKLVAIPVESARDVPLRMQAFRSKVDVIYVGSSGPIQPTLPVIATEADKMHIPIINVDDTAVKSGLVLGSFGVSFRQVGVHAGDLVDAVLKGKAVAHLKPIYPTAADHHAVMNLTVARQFGVVLPQDQGIEYVVPSNGASPRY